MNLQKLSLNPERVYQPGVFAEFVPFLERHRRGELNQQLSHKMTKISTALSKRPPTPEEAHRLFAPMFKPMIAQPASQGTWGSIWSGTNHLLAIYREPEQLADFLEACIQSIALFSRPLSISDRTQADYAATVVGGILAGGVVLELPAMLAIHGTCSQNERYQSLIRDIWKLGQSYIDKSSLDKLKSLELYTTAVSLAFFHETGPGAALSTEVAKSRLSRHAEGLLELSDLLWQEVCTDSRRTIRPDGLDMYEVKDPVHNRKTTRYFFSEPAAGLTLPRVGSGYEVRLSSGVSYFDPAPWEYDCALMRKLAEKEDWISFYDTVAELVALHYFVCRPPGEGRSGSGSSGHAGGEGKIRPIRGYERRLGPGQTPRPEAKALALRYLGRPLREGHTFVEDYEAPRGGKRQKGVEENDSNPSGNGLGKPTYSVDLDAVLSWVA